MNRIYIPYWEWEDWINGMWRKLSKHNEEYYFNLAIEFTGDHIKYGKSMMDVVKAWTNTMLHNLTNSSINKKAFVGHCACCYKHEIPEYIVRMGWKKLTDEQRFLANIEAEKAINYWIKNLYDREKKNKGIRKDMGRQMLLLWDS